MPVAYLDSSAIVKLVSREAETRELLNFLVNWPERATSEVAEIEVQRAVRRRRLGKAVQRRADRVLRRIVLIDLHADIRARAVNVQPHELRSLDATHLASALSLRSDLGVFVAYDERLVAAASVAGITVASPA